MARKPTKRTWRKSGVVGTPRLRRKRTQQAVAARAGRIVRVVGVLENAPWAKRYGTALMAQWARRMARASRGLPATKTFWAPRDPLAAFAAYQPGDIPVHAVTVHAHGRRLLAAEVARGCGPQVHIGKRWYELASVVRAVARWKPRRIVLFVCRSADAWKPLADVRVPVWACSGDLNYSALHEGWEAAGCPCNRRTSYTKVIAETGMRRVQ